MATPATSSPTGRGSSSPPIHTRLDTPTHQLVAQALAHRGQETSPGFTLWSPLASHGVDELMREAPKRTVLVLSFGRPSWLRICSVGILSKGGRKKRGGLFLNHIFSKHTVFLFWMDIFSVRVKVISIQTKMFKFSYLFKFSFLL